LCTPLAIAATAISAAGQTAQFAGASSQAKAQNQFQAQRYTETANAAILSYQQSLNQIAVRSQQEAEAAAQEGNAARMQATAAAATTSARAAASGFSGNSVTQLLNEFSFMDAANQNTLDTNLNWTKAQLSMESQGLRSQATGQIRAATPQFVKGPSPLAFGLQLAGTALSGLAQGNQMLPPDQQGSVGGWWFRPVSLFGGTAPSGGTGQALTGVSRSGFLKLKGDF